MGGLFPLTRVLLQAEEYTEKKTEETQAILKEQQAERCVAPRGMPGKVNPDNLMFVRVHFFSVTS